jgi:undecaprenyl-diphosphatase
MLDKLSLDSRLLVYLNGLGSETYDGLWLMVTKQQYWTPFFLLLYVIFKKIGTKQFLYVPFYHPYSCLY